MTEIIQTVEDSKVQAIAIIEQNELSSDEATSLKNALTPFFEQAEEWVQKAKTLKVTDENQIEQMVEARKTRMALKDIRVNLDKKRKELKEESLRKGKAIDGMANILKFLIEPIEEYLEKQEKFVENLEIERRKKLEIDRAIELTNLGVDTSFYQLADMPQATFEALLVTAKETRQLKLDAEKKAEDDRIKNEKAEAEQKEKERIENERIREENRIKDEELKKEREAKEKLEKEKRDREEKERKEKEKKEREEKAEAKRLAKMGDKEKIKAIAEQLEAIKLPADVKSDDAWNLVEEIESAIHELLTKINNY